MNRNSEVVLRWQVELPEPWTSFKGVGSVVCYLNNEQGTSDRSTQSVWHKKNRNSDINWCIKESKKHHKRTKAKTNIPLITCYRYFTEYSFNSLFPLCHSLPLIFGALAATRQDQRNNLEASLLRLLRWDPQIGGKGCVEVGHAEHKVFVPYVLFFQLRDCRPQ